MLPITLGVSGYKYMWQICKYKFSWVAHIYVKSISFK